MSSVDLDPLSDEAKRLLAFERAFSPQPAGLRERAFSRARAALGRSVGVVAPDVRQWRHTRLLMAAAVVMVLTAVAFAKWGGSLPTVEGPAVSAQATKGPSKGSTAAPSTPVAAADATTETASPPAAALPQKGELAAARPSPGVDAYSLELALLQRARAAVASGRFSAALHAIAEHQRRFPTGHFLEEREALRVKALAGLGRTDEAHRAAEKFRSRFPDSVLSSRIEGAIQEAP